MNERQLLTEAMALPSTRGLLKALRVAFDVRVDPTLTLIEKRKVQKYVFKPSGRTIWTVNGHLIYDVVGYCHCENFFFKFDTGYICHHILAQKLAERKGMFKTVEMNDEEFDKFSRNLIMF